MDNEYVKIYGKITDFDGNPISGATVRLLSYHFEDVYFTITDDNGKYEMKVEKDLYYAFYACKDYKINYLEYWAWNVPIHDDMELNARINGLEVYALNAFRVQGAYPAISLYFRPMSLIKGKNLDKSGYWDAETKNQKKYTEIFDICPQLSKDDIDVQVDGEKAEVLNVNKVLEYSGKAENGKNQYRYAYLLQVSLPQDYKNKRCQYKKIHITLTDRDTGEKGEGSVFWKEEETKMED